jgi:hypothetical protein
MLRSAKKVGSEMDASRDTQALLQEGTDGEWEVKEEYRGKLKYLDESGDEAWHDHSQVVMAVLENEPGKLN